MANQAEKKLKEKHQSGIKMYQIICGGAIVGSINRQITYVISLALSQIFSEIGITAWDIGLLVIAVLADVYLFHSIDKALRLGIGFS